MNPRIKKLFQNLRNEGPFLFIKKRFKLHILAFFLAPFYLLKVIKNRYLDISDSLKFVFKDSFGYLVPLQVESEISDLINLVKDSKPKIVMEIGTALGGTLFLFSKAIPEDSIIISLDLPGGRFGGGYPWWKIPLYKAFKKKSQKIILVRENSHLKETVTKIDNILQGKKIDFLFIDGDHSYEGVKKDFELYSPYVKSGGLIAFHDIVPVNLEIAPDCKVNIFWDELKMRYTSQEFIKDYSQGWAGIGVIKID